MARASQSDRWVRAGQQIHARGPGQSLEAWARDLPLLFLSNADLTQDVSNAVKKGLLRKVGRRLYTTEVEADVEGFVRSQALAIAALRCPGCVISHRSALEMSQVNGVLFLTGPKSTTEHFPGLVLKVRRGPGRLPGDSEFMGIAVASRARALLENLSYTRKSRDVTRSLARPQIEERLELLLRDEGEAGLNRLRDQAGELAPQLDARAGFEALSGIISALLGTREHEPLTASIAVARRDADKAPYDEARELLFDALVVELQTHWQDTSRPCPLLLSTEQQHLAFIDAYFSNYIEGTQFELDEAQAIVYERKIPSARPQDAHDILGTYCVLMDRNEMISATQTPSLAEFEYALQRRHATILGAWPDKRPGQYKRVANKAGDTHFVHPSLVRGTLARGLEYYARLSTPFQRAVFIMFLVAEVHPFDDGNGRLARIMMNAELAAGGEHRIIIPTVFRADYLGTLRQLSRLEQPSNFVRMLDRVHRYSSLLPHRSLPELIRVLHETHAFEEEPGWVLRDPVPP